jgi:hypothetical protein
MPTPFMHLRIAEQLRAPGRVPEDLRRSLVRELPAFYLGSVAPDYQVICAIPREQTHFYDLPPAPGSLAHEAMLAAHPELANAANLPPAQAVFIAAYMAHLMLDLRWYREVLVPFFLQPGHWRDHRHRFTIHNILLTHLDQQALATLPPDAGATLAAANPVQWLPFAGDADLRRWRDLIAAQLQPGAASQTVEIYADRLAMSPDEFAAKLASPTWMEEQLFSRVPVASVQAMLDSAMDQSAILITDYLK